MVDSLEPPKGSDSRNQTNEQRSQISESRSPEQTPARSIRLPRTFASLESRNFRFFWLGLLVMMAGLQMQMLARSYLAYELTGSAAILSVVTVSSAIPILILSLFGGVAADRFERRKVLQAGQITSAILAGLIALANTTDIIAWYHLLIVGTIQGAMWAFMMPARQAMIPQLVEPKHVNNAIALSSAALSATTLVAPAIAGLIYAYAGVDMVYYMISFMGLMSVVLTGQIPKFRGSGSGKKGAVFTEIGEGLNHIIQNRLVLVLLLLSLATTLFAMPFRFMLPVFIVDVYGKGPDSMGVMLGLFGLGALSGALFIASIGNWKRGMLLIITSFLSAVALAGLAALPFFVVSLPLMCLLGVGDSGRRSLNQALIIEEVDEQYRGRVMSVYMMMFGLMPLGMLPAGLIADWFGGQAAAGLLAFLLFVSTAGVVASHGRLRTIN